MQETIDHCGHGYGTKNKIKVFWRHMDKFALELNIATRNYGALLTSATATETSREPFSDEEIKTMWQWQEQPWVDSVLFLLYTGFRTRTLRFFGEISFCPLTNAAFLGGVWLSWNKVL